MPEKCKLLQFGKISSVSYVAGMMFLLTLVLTYCLAMTQLLVGLSLSALTLVAGFVISGAVMARFSAKRCFLLALMLNVALWVLSIYIGWHIYDNSWDGIAYHQLTIFALADGWNPVWDEAYKEWLSPWTIHYAKGLEVLSACTYKLTGDLESGKAVNFVLAAAAFLICFDCVGRLKPDSTKWNRVIFTLIAVGNPVWICQCLTFYIDFALYFYVLLSALFSIYLARGENNLLNGMGLGGVIILAIGTKFNHFFLEGVAMIAILGWLLIIGNKPAAWRVFKISLVAAVMGALVFGFHPYIANWMYQGNPFYPLMGDGAVDIMTCNTPQLYHGHNRFENFLLSIYGAIYFPLYDSRISGFGPLFNILFPICLACVLCAVIRRKRLLVIGYATFWVLGSCFLFEQSWWARYNPQVWLMVPLAYCSVGVFRSPIKRWGRWIIGVLGVLNILLSALGPCMVGLRVTVYRNAVYSVLDGKRIRAYVGNMWECRLREKGIIPDVVDEYAILEENRCPILHFPGMSQVYCWVEVEEADRARIDSIYLNSDVMLLRNTIYRMRQDKMTKHNN